MSREKPASTESVVGSAVRPMPKATASPPPSRTSATAMTAISAGRSRPRGRGSGLGHGGHLAAQGALDSAGAVSVPVAASGVVVVGMSLGPIGVLASPATSGFALKSGFSQLAPTSG